MGRIRTALGIAGLCVAVPVAAMVQSGEVVSTLETATRTYKEKGYSPAGWQKFGQLPRATDVRETVTLKGGRSYQIVGSCDEQCSDLDFQLFDARGKEIDWDAQDDDFPIVAAYASTTQAYTLRIVMSACKKSPCAYGVKAFVKDRIGSN